MRRLALGLLLSSVFSLSLFAAPAFSGTYAVSGKLPNNTKYTSTMTIVPREQVFDVQWTSGKTIYRGVGVLVNDTLAITYGDSVDRSWTGVIAYRQLPNGSLEGKWAIYGGAARTGSETAVRK